MTWTPAKGTRTVCWRLGDLAAVDVLLRLLSGDVPPVEQTRPPYRQVLLDIGDGHAYQLLTDETGERLAYWPRVWAARSLAYIQTTEVRTQLIAAMTDEHWRVRMTAAQTIGRLGIDGATAALVDRLDDVHPRVRSSALLALERVGDENAIQRLSRAVESGFDQSRAERALAKVLERAAAD